MDEESKKSYLEKLAGKLMDWDKKIDELKNKTFEATSDMKVEYQKIADDLRNKSKDAEDKIKQLKAASGEGWEEIKTGAEKALDVLTESISNAFSKFK